MNVITIPKKLVKKDDMVIIPRKEYELLLQRQPKVIPVVKLTTAEKRAIARSEKEFSRGEYEPISKIILESVLVFFGCKTFRSRRNSITIAPQSSGFSLKKSSKLI